MSGNSGRVVKNADEKPIVLSKPRLSVEEAKSSLRGRELELLRWLGISWPPRKKASHITCPIPGHRDRRPSWRWDDTKTRWICTCGSGDLIQLIQEVKGLDFPGAMDLIADFLGPQATSAASSHRAKRSPCCRGRGHGRGSSRCAEAKTGKGFSAVDGSPSDSRNARAGLFRTASRRRYRLGGRPQRRSLPSEALVLGTRGAFPGDLVPRLRLARRRNG